MTSFRAPFTHILAIEKRNKPRLCVCGNRSRILIVLALALCSTMLLSAQSAEDWFLQGLEAFQWQRVEEATGFFLKAAQTDPHSPEYPLYLALCYHQSGRLSEAEQAYSKSLSLGGRPDDVLLRRGTLRWSMGKIQEALDDFTTLVNAEGSSQSAALLNRANLELQESRYESAVKDYTDYLVLEPYAKNAESIKKIVQMLNDELEAKRLAEARRLAEEARLAEEEARKKALMLEVLESLSDSGEDTKSISAGSENLREDLEESVLED